MQLQRGQLLDRYRVDGFLGRGALADVYRVTHLELELPRALKLIRYSSPGVLDRFLQEGRIQSRLRHEGLVAVIDVLRLGGAPALVMELVEGPSLELLLRLYHPSQPQIDAIGRALMQALAYAHRKGLVHRDLKPANILIATQDDRVQPRISDFGLARLITDATLASPNPRMTRQGAMLGTPAYMAPEQYSDAASVDGRADVFALGAVLYELLTGVMAFPQLDAMGCYRAISEQSWRPVHELVPSAPDRMVRAVERALNPDPSLRVQSADQLLSLWTGEAEGRPVALPELGSALWEPSHLARIRAMAPPLAGFSLTGETVPDPGPRSTPAISEASQPAAATMTPPSHDELGEGAGQDPGEDEPEAQPPARRWGARMAIGGLLGLALCGLGAWLLWPDPDPVSAPPTAPVEAASAPPPPAPEEEPELPQSPPPAPSAPTPAPSTSKATTSAPSSTPEPTPRVESPPAEPETAPAPTENVIVSGVSQAWLVSPDGARVRPGKVAPGHYNLVVYFEPGIPTSVLDLEVREGRPVHIRCEPGLRLCR